MDDLVQRVRRYALRHRLWDKGDTIVVGVSGGPDSLCLLHVLRSLAADQSLSLHVAHLNHGLRGQEADADARAVAQLAAAWGLPYTIGTADVLTLAAQPGISLEEAGRAARYAFLAETASAAGAQRIAAGHTADDQAETVLMHFLRGSGPAGLRGMLPVGGMGEWENGGTGEWGNGRMGERENGGTGERENGGMGEDLPLSHSPTPPLSHSSILPLSLIRPLLPVTRAETEAYCAAQGLQPRYDPSNSDTTFFRNRLRHELLPILEQYNPAIRDVLARTAAVMAGDYEVLANETGDAWARVLVSSSLQTGGEVRLDLAAWRALPLGLQRAVLRAAVGVLRRHVRDLGWEHVERAVWLAREGHTGQRATLLAGLSLEIGYDTLRIADARGGRVEEEASVAGTALDGPRVTRLLALAVPGVTHLGEGWQVAVGRLERADIPPDFAANVDPWTAYLDADAVGPVLELRPPGPGERFQPLGMHGHSASLKEYMIDVKVPRPVRQSWPMLAGRGGIAWLCGLRVDERAAVRPETAVVWEVRFGRGG